MLRLLLEPIGVPAAITSDGGLVRAKGQERIEFLAAVRNALLPPLDGSPAVQQRSPAQVRRGPAAAGGRSRAASL